MVLESFAKLNLWSGLTEVPKTRFYSIGLLVSAQPVGWIYEFIGKCLACVLSKEKLLKWIISISKLYQSKRNFPSIFCSWPNILIQWLYPTQSFIKLSGPSPKSLLWEHTHLCLGKPLVLICHWDKSRTWCHWIKLENMICSNSLSSLHLIEECVHRRSCHITGWSKLLKFYCWGFWVGHGMIGL